MLFNYRNAASIFRWQCHSTCRRCELIVRRLLLTVEFVVIAVWYNDGMALVLSSPSHVQKQK
jgi:hypothetical protein